MTPLEQAAVLSIVTGVLASLVASGLFWFLQFRLRPKLDISPEISRRTHEGKKEFRFKLINRSRRSALEVRIHVFRDTLRRMPNGDVHGLHALTLLGDSTVMIPKFSKKDDDARYAGRYLILDDLDEVWEDDDHQSILVRVYARDGWSGVVKDFERQYWKKTAIKDGLFHKGNTFEIS